MDEPTSSLSEKEVNVLYKTIKDLQKRKIGIIYISHKLSEIFELTERVFVMRDGCFVNNMATNQTNTNQLVNLMVGRKLDRYYVWTFNDPGSNIAG